MKEWIDLTHLIDEKTLPYPGDDPIQRRVHASHSRDGFQMDTLCTQMHVGTHLDSPLHFISKGDSVDQLDIQRFIQKATVVHLGYSQGVVLTSKIEEELRKIKKVHSILLIDLSFSKHFNQDKYYTETPCFEDSFGDLLDKYSIDILGLDLPTIQYLDHQVSKAHQEILSKGIVLIEGLNHLEECHQEIDFIGLPLKLQGWDGSFIRAVGRNCD